MRADEWMDRHEKAKRRFCNIVNVSNKCKTAHLLRRTNREWESVKVINPVFKLLSCSENDNSSMTVFVLFHHT